MELEDFPIISPPTPAFLTRSTLRLDAGSSSDIARAADLLRAGGTVGFPTETVYGLGANALDAAAVAQIFLAKQRPSWDPLIVHISDRAMLEQVAILSGDAGRRAEQLIAAFWPGPLTLLLPRTAAIPDIVTAGRPLVGVRIPSSAIARSLIAQAGVPLAAPSANRFGHTSPTTAAHVFEDLDGRIDAVLDGGSASVGVESSVLDPGPRPMLLYRPGAITLEQIAAVAGTAAAYEPPVASANPIPESLPSPGVSLRHYAPRARLVLVADAVALLRALDHSADPQTVGIMLPNGWPSGAATYIYPWGPWADPAALAHRLFAGLRELDSTGVATILCPLPPATGLGAALRDRLKKAALAL